MSTSSSTASARALTGSDDQSNGEIHPEHSDGIVRIDLVTPSETWFSLEGGNVLSVTVPPGEVAEMI